MQLCCSKYQKSSSLLLVVWLWIASAYADAASPAWWLERGVIDPGAQANDFAAVNQGQVKHMASRARDELEAKLPGGAGSNLNAFVDGFANTNNYASVTLGELKDYAAPFYDRLIESKMKKI